MSPSLFRTAVSALLLTTGLTPCVAALDADKAPADSDSQVRDIEEIQVVDKYRAVGSISATKTPTPLVNVPQSLSVVTADQIRDQAFRDIGDLTRYIPGVSIGQGEGHRDQLTIRGQNTTADFFINGLRDDVQYFRPLYNLERVEVLRGANALIFGRGGGGGVINRVTKRPDFEGDFIGGTASVDTFGSYLVSSDVNIVANDDAAIRLNAYYEALDNHRDQFDGDRFGINPTALARIGDDTTLLFSYEYVYDDRVVDRGVPSLDGEPLRGFDNTFFGDPDANLTDFEGNILFTRLDHEFSEDLSVNATVQYANYDKLYQNLFPVGFDDAAGTTSLDGYRDATDRENFIAQVNFVGTVDTAGIMHTLLFGGEYGDQQTDNSRRDVLFADSNDDQITFAFSDPLDIPAFSFPVFNRDRSSDVQFFSAYVQDQIEVTSWLQLIGGVRYDRFEIDVIDQIEINNGTADGNDGFLDRVDTEWSPRVGAILKPQESISVYASFSRSFLPRSGDQFLTLTLNDEALAPEQFENYEAGVKWDINDSLSFTGSIFRLDREGGTTVDPTNVDNTIIVGSRTEGLELQLTGEVLPGWSINAGYSYLDADERGRVVGNSVDNRVLSQVPEHMFSLWNRVDITDKLSLGGGVIYQDTQFASISNAVELPDYVRVDLAAFYQLTDQISLQLNVENLFDEDYFPAAHNDNNISTGAPLNARFSISARF